MNLGEKNITPHVRAELRNIDKEQNIMTPTKLNEIDESFLKVITVDDEQCVNARDLHTYLEVGRDFSNWIKDRIEKYGFIEGKDFSPNLAKSTGGRPAIDYLLSLSMAKELAIVENNSKSQEIKCFLTEIELQNHSKVAQNGLSKHEEKTMTVKEVAEVLGVTERTVQRHLKEIRDITNLDNVVEVQNGIKSLITEKEATLIKKKIELSGRNDIVNPAALPKTNLEKQLLIRQAMQIQNEMIAELEAENEKLKTEVETQKPKAEYYDALIERGNSTNIRNTAKELNISEKKFVKMLLIDGFLYRDSKGQLFPYSLYVQKGYFEVKEWKSGERSGLQTLITVEGKQHLINKYKKELYKIY